MSYWFNKKGVGIFVVRVVVQDTVYFPCDMSVESIFIFDLKFDTYGFRKNWFPFFLSPKSKMAAK